MVFGCKTDAGTATPFRALFEILTRDVYSYRRRIRHSKVRHWHCRRGNISPRSHNEGSFPPPLPNFYFLPSPMKQFKYIKSHSLAVSDPRRHVRHHRRLLARHIGPHRPGPRASVCKRTICPVLVRKTPPDADQELVSNMWLLGALCISLAAWQSA